MKCPYCKDEDLVHIMPNDVTNESNESNKLNFVITLKNIKTNTFISNMGMPINIFLCNKCKNLTLKL